MAMAVSSEKRRKYPKQPAAVPLQELHHNHYVGMQDAQQSVQKQKQGPPKRRKNQRQRGREERRLTSAGGAPSPDGSLAVKQLASISDCETTLGDMVSSEQSDTSPQESPEPSSAHNQKLEEFLKDFLGMNVQNQAASPAFPPPEMSSETSSLDKVWSSHHPFASLLSAGGVDDHSVKYHMDKQASDEATKLSTEAKLFVPMATCKRISATWEPVVVTKTSPLQGVATVAAPATQKIHPSFAQFPTLALPPGLSMPLRREAAAFVPRYMNVSSTTTAQKGDSESWTIHTAP